LRGKIPPMPKKPRPKEKSTIQRNLEALLAASGKSMRKLSLEITKHKSDSMIKSIIWGDSRNPRADTIAAIEDYFQMRRGLLNEEWPESFDVKDLLTKIRQSRGEPKTTSVVQGQEMSAETREKLIRYILSLDDQELAGLDQAIDGFQKIMAKRPSP